MRDPVADQLLARFHQQPQGKLVGGTFKTTPLCSSVDETGCVISWVSFRENNVPPAGAIFGVGVGVLYSVTTISGPPLAIALNNQGFAKREFRAALGFVRLAESSILERYV